MPLTFLSLVDYRFEGAGQEASDAPHDLVSGTSGRNENHRVVCTARKSNIPTSCSQAQTEIRWHVRTEPGSHYFSLSLNRVRLMIFN